MKSIVARKIVWNITVDTSSDPMWKAHINPNRYHQNIGLKHKYIYVQKVISRTFRPFFLQIRVLLEISSFCYSLSTVTSLSPAQFLRLIICNQPESHINKPGIWKSSGVRPVSTTLYEKRTYVTADGVCSLPLRFLPSLHAMLLVQSASRGVSIKGTQSLIQH